jgi:hypothetical protein
MAATLTATGITFDDGTSLSSKYSVLAQNTVSVFYQASAPTGWSKVTSHNDKALRLVNGTGGGFGFGGTSGAGGNSFTTVFPNSTQGLSVIFNATIPVSGTVGGHTLTVAEIPNHTHNSLVGPSATASSGSSTFRTSGTNATGGVVSPTGTGNAHDHPWSGSIAFNTTGAGTIDLRLQYVDVILCSFD